MALSYARGEGVDPFPGHSKHSVETLGLVEDWLRRAAALLGMPHYRVSVSAGVPNSAKSTAETFARDSSNELVIALSDSFFDWPELHRRGVLLHELLHGWVHPLSIFARDNAGEELGHRANEIFESAIGDLEEKAVDTLGHALAPLFPESPGAPA